jgi:hypothetical protein
MERGAVLRPHLEEFLRRHVLDQVGGRHLAQGLALAVQVLQDTGGLEVAEAVENELAAVADLAAVPAGVVGAPLHLVAITGP